MSERGVICVDVTCVIGVRAVREMTFVTIIIVVVLIWFVEIMDCVVNGLGVVITCCGINGFGCNGLCDYNGFID